MNRRDLLRSFPALAALPASAIRIINNEPGDAATTGDARQIQLEHAPGPLYLFVLNGQNCDIDHFCQAFTGTGVRGAVVAALDGDVDNFVRVYKLEE